MHQTRQVVLLTHTDMDGYGEEIVLYSMGFHPTVVHIDNKQVDDYILQYATDLLEGTKPMPDVLFITDIAPNSEVAKKVEELHQTGKCEIHLFDHHPTALELNQYEWAMVIPEKNGVKPCGTSLFYEFMKREIEVPAETESLLDRLVEEIRLYDTWDWEENEHVSAKELNDLFYLIGPSPFVESQIEKITKRIPVLFSSSEEKLLAVEKKRIEHYLKQKDEEMIVLDDFFTDGEGKPLVAGVVQADNYISELGHYLCVQNPTIDFALLLKLTNNKASLRAIKEEVSVIPLAKRYGGGGHSHAAGCNITSMGLKFMEQIFEKMKER